MLSVPEDIATSNGRAERVPDEVYTVPSVKLRNRILGSSGPRPPHQRQAFIDKSSII